MQITIDKTAGFCFGVQRAIDLAEEACAKDEEVFCLGEMVHNKVEMNRIERLGLQTIDQHQFKKKHQATVIFRAHGEPPLSYEEAKEQKIKLIDATCPIVKKLQDKINQACEDYPQVLLFGKKNHPEIIALHGSSNNKTIIIQDESDLDQIDSSKATILFCQTTKSKASLENMTLAIQKKLNNSELLSVHNSICNAVSRREPALEELASNVDLMLFIAGESSSNGKMLFDICKRNNTNSYYLSHPNELNKKYLLNVKSVGISGATSTPFWLLEETKKRINEIFNE